MLESALRAGAEPLTLLYVEDFTPPESTEGFVSLPVEASVLEWASSLGSGSRVMGVWPIGRAGIGDAGDLVFLDRPADPGNVGTVIRAVDALSGGRVVLGPGSADPFSPKAVRASAGSIFTCPPVVADFTEVIEAADLVVGLDPKSEREIGSLDLGGSSQRTALVLGSERNGLSSDVARACDLTVRIPMRQDGPESLNLALTCGIALYELARQRGRRRSA